MVKDLRWDRRRAWSGDNKGVIVKHDFDDLRTDTARRDVPDAGRGIADTTWWRVPFANETSALGSVAGILVPGIDGRG